MEEREPTNFEKGLLCGNGGYRERLRQAPSSAPPSSGSSHRGRRTRLGTRSGAVISTARTPESTSNDRSLVSDVAWLEFHGEAQMAAPANTRSSRGGGN